MARKYELKRRAEQQAATRRRIVEAAVELHGDIGPARTSIAAIAELAGVERPTVYRHFPTEADLFRACSSHSWAEHPAPDPGAWQRIHDPAERLRVGLRELYDYYGKHEQRLWNILRDVEEDELVRRFAAERLAHRERAVDVLSAGWGARGGQSRRLRAAVAHAVDYYAWRSLRRQGLSNKEAADLMAMLAHAAAGTKDVSERP